MNDSLQMMLRELKLPTIAEHAQQVAIEAERSGWSFLQFLHHLCEVELEDRRRRRTERLLKSSCLPRSKTMAALNVKRLPKNVQRILPTLCDGAFLRKANNILAFGLPGRGKTHVLAAIGHELVLLGHKILFVPAYKLVQRLLAAKSELRLEKELKKLDQFEAVIIDDIGYVQQDRDEMDVLFTFLAERYERRSVLISSNLVFSQWDRIFKDPMTTAAAIDRLVHHATILELTGSSYRTDSAKKEMLEQTKNRPPSHEEEQRHKKSTAPDEEKTAPRPPKNPEGRC